MTSQNASPLMLAALKRLHLLGRPAQWQEFALAPYVRSDGMRTTRNSARALIGRGLVTDVSVKYKPGDVFTGPRHSLYVLSATGLKILAEPPPRSSVVFGISELAAESAKGEK